MSQLKIKEMPKKLQKRAAMATLARHPNINPERILEMALARAFPFHATIEGSIFWYNIIKGKYNMSNTKRYKKNFP